MHHSRENSGGSIQSFNSADMLTSRREGENESDTEATTYFSPVTMRATINEMRPGDGSSSSFPGVSASGRGRFRYRLSAMQMALVALCALTGVIALFVAHMFEFSTSATFAVPVVERHWNRAEKSEACRRAAAAYFVLAGMVLLRPVLGHQCITHCRHLLWTRARRTVPKDRLAMLGYTRKGSDDGSEDDDEMT